MDPWLIGSRGEGEELVSAVEDVDGARLAVEAIEDLQRHRKRARRHKGSPFGRDGHVRPGERLHLRHRGHGIHRRIIPCGVADVRLVHHVIPFAMRQLVVVVIAQLGILGKQCARLVRQVIRAHPTFRGVKVVHARGDVQFVHHS